MTSVGNQMKDLFMLFKSASFIFLPFAVLQMRWFENWFSIFVTVIYYVYL